MMADVPLIGSDSPGIGRIVEETRTGEVCDPEDPEALAAAMRRILDDPDRYRKGLKEARARYNWEVEEAKLLALYEGLGASS